MEYVTDAYKEAMKANVRGKSYVWVSLDLVNIYAQESAYISSSFTGSETGLYDDSISVNSVTSSENDGSITFTFGEYTKLLLCGVRFTLNDEFQTVTATNGTQTKTVEVETNDVVIEQTFTNCHYIKLTPNSGSLSLKKVYFGIIMDFDHDVIMNTSRRNTIKHLNEELPIKEFSFTMHNYDRLWNKDNPDSLARFVMEKQKIYYTYGRDIGEAEPYEIVGGVVYLNDFSSDDYKATFSGVGLLDYLQEDYKKGNIYPDGITLYQLAELVLLDAGIKNYELDSCLRTFKVTNPLPVDTHKACLQLIAHAGRCVLFEDRNGAVCLKSIDRPVIYKTGYVINATNFSSGEDVVNPLTVANYASTEPSYTYADGLQYFFPETKEPVYLDNLLLPYDDGRVAIQNVAVNTDEDGYVSFSGINAKYGYLGIEYYLRSQYSGGSELLIPPGKYVFGAYPSKEEGSIKTPYGVARTGFDQNIHGYYAVIILNGNRFIYSYESLSNRSFSVNSYTRIYGYIYIFERDCTYNFFPRLVREDDVTTNTLETLPVGFVSEEYANSNGGFTNIPEIDIRFTSPCILTELVMNCAVAPKDFTIRCYLKNNQVALRTITDNTNPQVDETFVNLKCDKFTVTFTKTLAGQRIHVNSVEPVAAIDYEITYKDMTLNPIATELEKVSRLDCELYRLGDPRKSGASFGSMSIEYNEIEGGGVSADIISGKGALTYVHVTAGINIIDIGNASIIDSVSYSDGGEGGTIDIIESGAFYVKINCSREGDVVVNGTEYVDSIVNYTVPVNEIGNPVKVSNPLISTEAHINRLKDWFLDHYENDIEYRFNYRGDPVLDADDQIFIENKFVANNLVRIESEELSTSAGMDTSNQIIARRLKYSLVSKTVLRDFVLSNEVLYLEIGQNSVLSGIDWTPNTALDKSLTWASSNTAVATVDNRGNVIAVSEGTAYITATSSNNIVHTCVVNVFAKYVAVTSFDINEETIITAANEEIQLVALRWEPSNATNKRVTWRSSDTTLATVSETGLVRTIMGGHVTITATCPDGISRTSSLTIFNVAATDFTLYSL